LLAHVGSLEETEQVLGVERIEGIAWQGCLEGLVVVGRRDARSESDSER
jgi:hypothetical protein